MINYYEILQLDNLCDDNKAIKNSFKYLVTKNHPDKGGNKEIFEKIKEAYDILRDPIKKKEYDNKLIYYIEVLERAEEINITDKNIKYKCIQCDTTLLFKYEEIKPNMINIYKCDGCSKIYKLNIRFNI